MDLNDLIRLKTINVWEFVKYI